MRLVTILLLLCLGESWYSDSLPESNQTVLDPDHLLAADTQRRVDQILAFSETFDGCLPEAMIVVVQSIQGEAVDFCEKVHQRWHVGVTNSGCNHGVTAAFAISNRQMCIYTGDGLGWRFPTLAKHDVMDKARSPLRDGQIDEAILVYSCEMARYIRGEIQPVSDWIAAVVIITVLVLVCLLVVAADSGKRGGSSVWIISSNGGGCKGSGSGSSW